LELFYTDQFLFLTCGFKLIKNPIKNSTKRVVKEKYDQIILEKLSNLDENSKLFLYNKLKNEIKQCFSSSNTLQGLQILCSLGTFLY
jgi:hypothetical protein